MFEPLDGGAVDDGRTLLLGRFDMDGAVVFRTGGTYWLAGAVADTPAAAVIDLGVARVRHRMHGDFEFVAGLRKQAVAVGGLERRHRAGLLAWRREGVVAAGDADRTLGGEVVRPEVAVVDGPVSADAAFAR